MRNQDIIHFSTEYHDEVPHEKLNRCFQPIFDTQLKQLHLIYNRIVKYSLTGPLNGRKKWQLRQILIKQSTIIQKKLFSQALNYPKVFFLWITNSQHQKFGNKWSKMLKSLLLLFSCECTNDRLLRMPKKSVATLFL